MSDIEEVMKHVRSSAHRNVTEIEEALARADADRQRTLDVMTSATGDPERNEILEKVKQREADMQRSVAANFSSLVEAEVRVTAQQLAATQGAQEGTVRASFGAASTREFDLRRKIQPLAQKIAQDFDTRDEQIGALNSSLEARKQLIGERLDRLSTATNDAIDNSDNVKIGLDRKVQGMQERLTALLREAERLTELRAQIEAVSLKTNAVDKKKTLDYQGVGLQAAKTVSDIAAWRAKLQAAIRSLGEDLGREMTTRLSSHLNSTLEMQVMHTMQRERERERERARPASRQHYTQSCIVLSKSWSLSLSLVSLSLSTALHTHPYILDLSRLLAVRHSERITTFLRGSSTC
jgi:hypothetical protein